MLTPAFVGRLRRLGLWTSAQSVHRAVSPRLCSGIHAVVGRLGSRFLPDDLVLKHIYDYGPVHVDPALITTTLKVGEWHRRDPSRPESRWVRARRWYEQGGGWKSARRHVTRNLHSQFVADGDWDLRARPLELRPTIVEMFQEGRAPAETDEYRQLKEWVEAGRFGWTRGCRTLEDVDRYFAELVDVFERIRRHGYRTQQELGNDGSDEIRVCIDRHGRLSVFGGGTHRLSIARVLELERVPVLVKRVHARWVADWVRRCGGTDRLTALDQGIRELESRKAVTPRG